VSGSGASGVRPEVKICGVTRVEDAVLSVELGADYLGLNFFPGSPRFLGVEKARKIARAVRGRTVVVGVVVDLPSGEIERLVERVGLDLVQFHGDETPEQVAPFRDLALRAFRWREGDEAPDLAPWRDVRGWLFDYHEAGRYGGTGKSWRYERLAEIEAGPKVFVAGGIRPDNVRRALAASRAAAVDVCSGVETAPGRKDPALLRRLFEEVRDDE
jgi:phosphoribosylanthranilate isomerase